jgi:hypothetical protein
MLKRVQHDESSAKPVAPQRGVGFLSRKNNPFENSLHCMAIKNPSDFSEGFNLFEAMHAILVGSGDLTSS